MSLAKTAQVLANLQVQLAELDPALAAQVLPILRNATTVANSIISQILKIFSDRYTDLATEGAYSKPSEAGLDEATQLIMRVRDLVAINNEASNREALRVFDEFKDFPFSMTIFPDKRHPGYAQLQQLISKLDDALRLGTSQMGMPGAPAQQGQPAAKTAPTGDMDDRIDTAVNKYNELIEKLQGMQSDAETADAQGHGVEAEKVVSEVIKNPTLRRLLEYQVYIDKGRLAPRIEQFERTLAKAEPILNDFERRIVAIGDIE